MADQEGQAALVVLVEVLVVQEEVLVAQEVLVAPAGGGEGRRPFRWEEGGIQVFKLARPHF